MSKSKILVVFGVLLACAAVYLMLPGPASRDLTVVSWGGSTQDGLRETVLVPFSNESGAQVDEDTYNGELELIRDMVEAGNVSWDLVHVEDDMLHKAAAENWLASIPEDFASEAGLEASAVNENGVAFFSWATVMAFNTDRLQDEELDRPEDWSAFWDEKYPGPFGFRKSPIGTVEIALLANGTSRDELYPLNEVKVQKALRHLDGIRDKISWWSGGAEHQQKLLTDYTMACAWSGRVWVMIQKKEPVGMTMKQCLARFDWWAIPKGTPNQDQALELLRFWSQPDIQAAFCESTGYGPSNTSAVSLLSPDLQKHVPDFGTEDGALLLDGQWWAENISWVEPMWTKWISE